MFWMKWIRVSQIMLKYPMKLPSAMHKPPASLHTGGVHIPFAQHEGIYHHFMFREVLKAPPLEMKHGGSIYLLYNLETLNR